MRTVPKVKIAGVIGYPVGHSLSPPLHGYWLQKYAVDGSYIPLPVKPDNLRDVIKALPMMGFRGVNVTVPHKEQVVLLVDDADEISRKTGAANTLFFDEASGQIRATNTDVYGFIENIKQTCKGWSARGTKAVIIGAGGAARAVCVGLMQEQVGEIILVNRTRDRAEQVARDLGAPIKVESWENRHAALENAALLVNASALGMRGYPPLDIDMERLPAEAIVTDIVYAPLITDFLEVARERGNPIVDGLGMLLYQARPGFKGWFGVDPEVDDTLRDLVLKRTL